MPRQQPLSTALSDKVQEQIERTAHLIALLPGDESRWTLPASNGWPVEMLLGHLLDCLAGFCAVLAAAEPVRLTHFAALRALPVNQACTPEDAVSRIMTYSTRIHEGFELLSDADLAKPISTLFVPQGELLLTLLLGNLEHLINHKHELFTCLKQMGVAVGSCDLYRFRGAPL